MFNRKMLGTFLAGFVLGIAATFLARPFLGERLPEAVSGRREAIRGLVTAKQRDADRLLLTIVTSTGASLATFNKQVSEIDLLVDEGDTVTLALRGYQPFLQDPEITGVNKPSLGGRPEVAPPEAALPDTLPASELPEVDTLEATDTLGKTSASRWYD